MDTLYDDGIKHLENLNIEEDLSNKDILNNYPKYLPLGSVVLLKNGLKKVMIVGFAVINAEEKSEVYDYMGCLYPEGIIQSNSNIVFNHENISKIYAIGMVDDTVNDFLKELKEVTSKQDYREKVLKQLE